MRGQIQIWAVSLRLLGLASCSGPTYPDFDAYSGSPRSTSEVAIFEDASSIQSIKSSGYIYFDRDLDGWAGTVRLLPGHYEVSYHSYQLEVVAASVDVLAGHIYRAQAVDKICFFCWRPGPRYTWIEDKTTGQVLSGAKP